MIERTDRGPIAVLRLAHGTASALDAELCDAIAATFEGLADSPPRAVVLTGTDAIFSAGVDLFRVLDGGEAYLGRFMPALEGAFGAVFRCPLPVVAAINGHAIAGGCVLASCCDRRIMTRGRATIGVPELKVGVPFPTLGLEIMRAVLPPQHFQTVVYGGGNYGPDDALRMGLVDELADAGALLGRAEEVARDMASIPAETFAISKRAIRAPALERVARDGPARDAEVLAAWRSAPVREAIARFVERTLGKRG